MSLSALLKSSTLDDHEEILNAADAALQKSKTDTSALHSKLVALLNLDRFDEAVRLVDDHGDALKQAARLESAYALYKGGRLKEAEELAEGGDGARGLKHLAAQAAYRDEDFAKTAEVYAELSRDANQAGEENDLRINWGATDAQLAWAGQTQLMHKTKHEKGDMDSFESAFNQACSYIGQGDLKTAEVLLKAAATRCNDADELSQEEKEAELLPITVQRIYVAAGLGKAKEAEDLSSGIKISSISDPATRHIANSNILKITSPQSMNSYLAHRIYHSTAQIPAKAQPFQYQNSILHRNALTLELQAGKHSGVADSTSSQILKSTPGSTSPDITRAGVFNAAAHAKNQTSKAAIKQLLPLLEKRPSDVGLLLTVIQLYVLNNNTAAAATLLETFLTRLETASPPNLDTRFAPGLVALLVSLYAAQNRPARTKAELAKAATHWRRKSKTPAPSTLSLLKAAGAAILAAAPTPDEAATAHDLFSAAAGHSPSDPAVQAGLVASSPNPSPSQLSALPDIADLTRGIDAAALESAGVPLPPTAPTSTSTSTSTARKRSAAPAAANAPTQPKRPRKSKMPATYDPARTPNPERWLPLQERSNWRPKGKKKGRAGATAHGGERGGATQGGVVAERPGTPSAGGGGGGGGKKGKKGRK